MPNLISIFISLTSIFISVLYLLNINKTSRISEIYCVATTDKHVVLLLSATILSISYFSNHVSFRALTGEHVDISPMTYVFLGISFIMLWIQFSTLWQKAVRDGEIIIFLGMNPFQKKLSTASCVVLPEGNPKGIWHVGIDGEKYSTTISVNKFRKLIDSKGK